MSLTPGAEDVTIPLDQVAVPVGLAVPTWLSRLLAVGFNARLGSLSVPNVLPAFFWFAWSRVHPGTAVYAASDSR